MQNIFRREPTNNVRDLSDDNPHDPYGEYSPWEQHEERWRNRGALCAALRRLAFSPARRLLLRLPKRIVGEYWHERVLDALYPTTCYVAFKARAEPII